MTGGLGPGPRAGRSPGAKLGPGQSFNTPSQYILGVSTATTTNL